jgi:hypothetical protein
MRRWMMPRAGSRASAEAPGPAEFRQETFSILYISSKQLKHPHPGLIMEKHDGTTTQGSLESSWLTAKRMKPLCPDHWHQHYSGSGRAEARLQGRSPAPQSNGAANTTTDEERASAGGSACDTDTCIRRFSVPAAQFMHEKCRKPSARFSAASTIAAPGEPERGKSSRGKCERCGLGSRRRKLRGRRVKVLSYRKCNRGAGGD